MTLPANAHATVHEANPTGGLSAATFDARLAVPLAHAFIDAVCQNDGLRALAIKGPTLAIHGLRAEKDSSDADVLASPSDFDALCAALQARGWSDKATRSVPGALPSHSRSFIHASWPIDIDIHSFYPGFFGRPEQVFELLWHGRVSTEIAHHNAQITGRVGSAVISALHSHRHPRSVGHVAELLHLTEVLRQDLSATERLQILDLVRVGRAQTVLADFLADIGITEIDGDLTEGETRLWTFYRATHDDGATGGWLLALGEARWRDKPALLARALVPKPAELLSERQFAGLSRLQLVPVYLHRLARGFSAFPAARRAAAVLLRGRMGTRSRGR